jgi:hypothetical protein
MRLSLIALLISMGGVTCSTGRAFMITLTNAGGGTFPEALLTDSTGQPLAIQSLGKIAAISPPAGTSPASLSAQCGLPLLWSYTTTFGPDVRIGSAVVAPGKVQSEIRQALPSPLPATYQGKSIFCYFFNASTMSQATEALLLQFPTTLFQGDFAIGFEAQVRLHLSQATVHLGSRQPNGSLRTAPLPWPCYANWATTALGNAAKGQRDDPDHDGVCNLLEYVAGTNPALPDAALSRTVLVRNGDQTVTFSWRQAALLIDTTCVPHAGASLTGSQPVLTPILTVLPPMALPPGIQWRSVTVPVSAARGFMQLKVSGP